MKLSRDDLKSLIGEGFHTAFRKALVSTESGMIWNAIQALPDAEWEEIIDFVESGFPDEEIIIPKRKRQQ